jgi:lipoprotein-anchoring transpeptidase ErfK/SrfK
MKYLRLALHLRVIGHKVSSGCIRMTNADVTDLYNRIAVGTKIIVLATATASAPAQ